MVDEHGCSTYRYRPPISRKDSEYYYLESQLREAKKVKDQPRVDQVLRMGALFFEKHTEYRYSCFYSGFYQEEEEEEENNK